MEKVKAFFKKVFCLPPTPTLAAAVFGFGLILAVVIFDIEAPAVKYAAYAASAYALAVSVTGLHYLKDAARAVKRFIAGLSVTRWLRKTKPGRRYEEDIRFRAWVKLARGLFVNTVYIAVKLFTGIRCRSWWFIALAVYYILLAATRVMLIRRVHVRDERAEWRRYRLCGVTLLLMNQALAGIVIAIVRQNRGFEYPGLLIYAMAAYSFYAVITAIVRTVKTRRHKSPILSAVRAVDLVAAMVSILALTTAMLPRFGGADSPGFRRAMTSAVGGGVCTAVITMAVFMIANAGRKLRETGSAGSGSDGPEAPA